MKLDEECSACEGNGRQGNIECQECKGHGSIVTPQGARVLRFIQDWLVTQEGRVLHMKDFVQKDVAEEA